jgi:hypothetical protein
MVGHFRKGMSPEAKDSTMSEPTERQLVWNDFTARNRDPTEAQKPDDAVLFDLMSRWAPDQRTRQRILVENPARLYRFEA